METQTRGRSPSAGQQNNQHIRSSPSPHDYNSRVSPTPFNKDSSNQIFTSQPYPTSNLSPSASGNINYNLQNTYLDAGAQGPPFQQFGDPSFDQPFQQNGLIPNGQQAHSPAQQSDQQFQTDMLSVDTNFGGFPPQQSFPKQQDFLLDPQLQAGGQHHDQSINPADIMSNLSTPQHLTNTPPNPMGINPQHSEPTSPFNQSAPQRPSPHHSRHSSLDPSSAVYPNGQQQQDWSNMMNGPQFQGHRRAPSEYSDVSSSAAPSPFMAQADNFDPIDQNHSPMLNPQQDQQLYTEGLGIENFTISDQQQQTIPSPRHSPYVSPRMSPQPGMMMPNPSLMQLPDGSQSYNGGLMQEAFPKQEQFPSLPPERILGSNNFHGQADQYDVPQINVESAPNTQQMLDSARSPQDIDALSPPERASRSRGRIRSLSDTHVTRSPSPSSTHSTLGSSEGSMDRRNHALSPHFSPGNSRSPSPDSRGRRSSTSSIPNRDYILELAGDKPTLNRPERIQKHPATFSCHLCPKKFTRAYNLRSHLRTHTDERPFVCTVCSKAFARQHDRKRHEGLHSGEKKFVCRGELGTGATWGCGRRFARADALGRHFRSEAGRVCIKPLLDEEAMERQKMDDHMMQSMNGMAPQAPMNGMPMQQPFAFPAALLQQFPALQGLQWDQLGNGPDDDAGDISGRSSFDASSGGDFYDDDDGGSGYVSDNPMTYGQGGGWQHDHGWKSDIEP